MNEFEKRVKGLGKKGIQTALSAVMFLGVRNTELEILPNPACVH